MKVYNKLNDYQKMAMFWLCKGMRRHPLEFHYDGVYKIQLDHQTAYSDKIFWSF